MQILRHTQIAITMQVYREPPRCELGKCPWTTSRHW
jgi:hypothetical protein